MKLQNVFFGLALTALPLSAAFAQTASLTLLKECQSLAEMKLVKDAEEKSVTAKNDILKTRAAVKKYEQSCSTYKLMPRQENIQDVISDGKQAGQAAVNSRASIKAATEVLNTAKKPIQSLGGDACANTMNAMGTQFKELQEKAESDAAALEKCTMASAGSAATSTATQSGTAAECRNGETKPNGKFAGSCSCSGGHWLCDR